MERRTPRILPWLAAGALLAVAVAWLARDTRPPAGAGERSASPAPSLALPSPTPELEPVEGSAARGSAPPAHEATPPARARAVDAAAPEPWIDASGEPSRELVRAALEAAIADHHASHKLTLDEVERITDAAVDLRAAQRALRELPETAAVADERRALRERIADADAEFAEVMEMSFAEFTAQAGGGVDRDAPGEAVPPPEYLDDFR